MEDWQQLLRDADRKFDEGDYAGALDDYRAAATQSPPEEVRLATGNMVVTAEAETIMIVRKQWDAHPDSLELQRLYANTQRRLPYMDRNRVVDLYTALLAKETDPYRIFDARRKRFDVALQGGITRYLIEDLQYAWQNSTNKQKRALLHKIASIADRRFMKRDERHVELFDQLSKQEFLPPAVKAFFAAKAAQHRALTAAFDALPDDESAP